MSITSTTVTARAALLGAILLLSAQTLAQAHVHEPAAEAACAVCTVSGEHVLPAGTPGTHGVSSSRTAIPREAGPSARRPTTRCYHTRAPPRF